MIKRGWRLGGLLGLLVLTATLAAWTVAWPRHGPELSRQIARRWSRLHDRLGMQKGVFKGHYLYTVAGIDSAPVFRPCGLDETWSVRGNLERVAVLRSTDPRLSGEIYVEWGGKVTPKGKHGHLGLNQRELIVTNELTVRPSRRDDCR
jgi:hypothetical protein